MLFILLALVFIVVLYAIGAETDLGRQIERQNSIRVVEDDIDIPNVRERNLDIAVDVIIERESSGREKICNKQYGCIAGMGLMGIISGTWNETIVRISKKGEYKGIPQYCFQFVYLPVNPWRSEPIFDPVCNRAVGKWLLATDGFRHWEDPNGEWGSGPYVFDFEL